MEILAPDVCLAILNARTPREIYREFNAILPFNVYNHIYSIFEGEVEAERELAQDEREDSARAERELVNVLVDELSALVYSVVHSALTGDELKGGLDATYIGEGVLANQEHIEAANKILDSVKSAIIEAETDARAELDEDYKAGGEALDLRDFMDVLTQTRQAADKLADRLGTPDHTPVGFDAVLLDFMSSPKCGGFKDTVIKLIHAQGRKRKTALREAEQAIYRWFSFAEATTPRLTQTDREKLGRFRQTVCELFWGEV